MALMRPADSMSRQQGFTLIELMMVVVVIAILAAIALPNYRDHVIKSRRAAATACLLEIAQVAERVYTTDMSYAATPDPDGMQCESDSDEYYTITLDVPDARSYTVQAVPVAGRQDDPKCETLTLDQIGTKGESGTESVDECW